MTGPPVGAGLWDAMAAAARAERADKAAKTAKGKTRGRLPKPPPAAPATPPETPPAHRSACPHQWQEEGQVGLDGRARPCAWCGRVVVAGARAEPVAVPYDGDQAAETPWQTAVLLSRPARLGRLKALVTLTDDEEVRARALAEIETLG